MYLKICNSSENVSTRMLWKIRFVLFLIISFIYIYIYIIIVDVVHSSCYYEHLPKYPMDFYYTYDETCLFGCCEPFDPEDQKPCCDPTGVIVGIAIGFIILCIVLAVCFRIMRRNTSKYYLTCSHVVLRVLVFSATFNNNSVISWRQD